MYWVLLCLSSGTDLQKSRHVLKSLSLCNKVLSYLSYLSLLSLSLFFSIPLSPCLPRLPVSQLSLSLSLSLLYFHEIFTFSFPRGHFFLFFFFKFNVCIYIWLLVCVMCFDFGYLIEFLFDVLSIAVFVIRDRFAKKPTRA